VPKREPKPESTPAPRTFEESLGRLEQIVHRLEEGQSGLDESLGAYEEGVKLLRHCYSLLEGAQRRIELLTGVDSAGNPVTEPMDDTALTLDEKAEGRSRRRTSSTEGESSSGGCVNPNAGGVDEADQLF
jgi:exodeoxyribonuclease VII small subunit